MRAYFNMMAGMRFESIGIQDFPRFIVVVGHEDDFIAVNLHGALEGLEWSPPKLKLREVLPMEIKKVGVLGCGLMGSGIAQACATAGFDVISLEIDQKYIDKGFAGIRKSLAKFSAKGALKEPVDQILARLKGTTRKEDLAGCDIIIEAIIENLDEKRKMYASLDSIVQPPAIFASNTAS